MTTNKAVMRLVSRALDDVKADKQATTLQGVISQCGTTPISINGDNNTVNVTVSDNRNIQVVQHVDGSTKVYRKEGNTDVLVEDEVMVCENRMKNFTPLCRKTDVVVDHTSLISNNIKTGITLTEAKKRLNEEEVVPHLPVTWKSELKYTEEPKRDIGKVHEETHRHKYSVQSWEFYYRYTTGKAKYTDTLFISSDIIYDADGNDVFLSKLDQLITVTNELLNDIEQLLSVIKPRANCDDVINAIEAITTKALSYDMRRVNTSLLIVGEASNMIDNPVLRYVAKESFTKATDEWKRVTIREDTFITDFRSMYFDKSTDRNQTQSFQEKHDTIGTFKIYYGGYLHDLENSANYMRNFVRDDLLSAIYLIKFQYVHELYSISKETKIRATIGYSFLGLIGLALFLLL